MSRLLAPVLLLALVGSAAAAPLTGPDQLVTDYRAFVDDGRTPARVVAHIVAAGGGFERIDPHATAVRRVRAGERLLFVNQDRTAILVVVGATPLLRGGARLIGSHIDTPSPRLAIAGIDRRGQVRLTARHYGGMRRHHWGHTPVAIVGRVARPGGGEIDIALGLDDDFAFQAEPRGDDELAVTTSAMPADAPGARTVMGELHRRYGLTAPDLRASELYLVPRARARLVGVDGALIGAHGQDDRANSYAAWRAIADQDGTPPRTAMAWLVDREEVGSTGRTGARSRFLESVYAWLLRAEGAPATEAALHRAMAASVMLSADTPACIHPGWPEVQEARNAPVIGGGPALFPFTGHGGKSGGSAAGAALIASVRRSFDRAGVPLQFGELGRVDEGGGGTIARHLAERGIDVVDVGVCVVGLHSPLELAAVDDLWSAYRGFKAWLAEP